MASLLSSEIQDVRFVTVGEYNGAESGQIFVSVPMETPVEGIDMNPDSNLEFLTYSEYDEVIPQPVEVVIDGSGPVSDGLEYIIDQENVTDYETCMQRSSPESFIKIEGFREQSPQSYNRKGKGGRKNGTRSKCRKDFAATYENSRNNNIDLSSVNGDFSLHPWTAEVKKEPGLDGIGEEVTISSLVSPGDDFDSICWARSSGDFTSGIDLDDQQQLMELSRPRQNYVSDDPDRVVQCPHPGCGKAFKDNATMKKHMHVHGPKNYSCAECGRSFVESSKLKRHQLVHTGEKSFQCTFKGCNKRFSLDFNLRTHIRIHTGDRPFVCTYPGCTKKFAQSTNLKSHLLTHDKQKNSSVRQQFDYDEVSSAWQEYDN